MSIINYYLNIQAEDEQAIDVKTRNLTDKLREIDGVLSADRIKYDKNTMDLGSVIGVIATSGATLALAQGIADWLRTRRDTTVSVEQTGSSGSIKATVHQIDPETAKQIIELLLNV